MPKEAQVNGRMLTTRRLQWLSTAILLALVVGFLIAFGSPATDPPSPGSGYADDGQRQRRDRFDCLSYSPFRRADRMPWGDSEPVTEAEIEQDLRLLIPLTACVRTYGTSMGLDKVPAVAQRLGLRVWVGAWIGRDRELNNREISRALELAAAHPRVVERVIVGSETLLRGEQTPEALASLLSQVRERSSVPVAYADVWEFWLRHADALVPVVDEALIHILPYWEDDPVVIGKAVDHVFEIWTRMRQRLSARPVIIGETGWPVAGRARGGAVPGLEQQTRFLRQLQSRASEIDAPINIVEAFDQPWKAALEGLAGGSWGLFTADGTLRLRNKGFLPPTLSIAGIGLIVIAGIALGLLAVSAVPHARVIGMLGGTWVAILASIQIQQLQFAAFGSGPWWSRFATLTLSSVWALVALRALTHSTITRAPIAGVNLSGLITVDIYAIWLALDGRYLDLAWPALAGPVSFIALRTISLGRWRAASIPALMLSATLWAASAAVLVNEGVENRSALWLVMLMWMLAACSMLSQRIGSESR